MKTYEILLVVDDGLPVSVTRHFPESFNPHPGSRITIHDDPKPVPLGTVRVLRTDFTVHQENATTLVICTRRDT